MKKEVTSILVDCGFESNLKILFALGELRPHNTMPCKIAWWVHIYRKIWDKRVTRVCDLAFWLPLSEFTQPSLSLFSHVRTQLRSAKAIYHLVNFMHCSTLCAESEIGWLGFVKICWFNSSALPGQERVNGKTTANSQTLTTRFRTLVMWATKIGKMTFI